MITRRLIRRALPRVPSTTPVFQGPVLTTTTNETTTTFAAAPIGTPHPKRIVILAIYAGVAGAANLVATVNGISPFFVQTSNIGTIQVFQVPNDTTADIVVSLVNSTRKAVAVFVAYPNYILPLDSGTITVASGTPMTLADAKVQAGGFLVYLGMQNATVGAFGTAWGGADAVVEDADAQLEAAASYTMGHVNVTVSTDLDDLVITPTVNGNASGAFVSWGPPAPGN